MPTYDYVCAACDHAFEHFQSISDKLLRTCPQCKKRRLERQFGTGIGVVFKGSGFYETDYKRSGSEGGDTGKKSADSDKSGAGSSGKTGAESDAKAGSTEGKSKGKDKTAGSGAGSKRDGSAQGQKGGSGKSKGASPGGGSRGKPKSG